MSLSQVDCRRGVFSIVSNTFLEEKKALHSFIHADEEFDESPGDREAWEAGEGFVSTGGFLRVVSFLWELLSWILEVFITSFELFADDDGVLQAFDSSSRSMVNKVFSYTDREW